MSSIFQSDTLRSSSQCRSVVFHVSFCFAALHSGSHQLVAKWKSVGRDGAVVSPVVPRSALMELVCQACFHRGPSRVAVPGAACHCEPAGGNVVAPAHVVETSDSQPGIPRTPSGPWCNCKGSVKIQFLFKKILLHTVKVAAFLIMNPFEFQWSHTNHVLILNT